MASQLPQLGGPSAESAGQKPKNRLLLYSVIGLTVAVVAAAIWFFLPAKSKSGHPSAAASPGQTNAALAGSAAAVPSDNRRKSPQRNVNLPVPLTRMPVKYSATHPRLGTSREAIYVLDAEGIARDEAVADKIYAMISGGGVTRTIVTRLALRSNLPDFIERLNPNRQRLLSVAAETLASKSAEHLARPGLQNLLRQELATAFDLILGTGTIKEVIFLEFHID